ncbi:MAG: retropepsin-like aspartic protease [Planctomycetota bacterium]
MIAARFAALALLLVACATSGPPRLSVEEADRVLDELFRVARPRFADTRDGAWAWSGAADYLGEPARFRFEWQGSRFVRQVNGRLGRTVGFDGEEGWSRSSRGLVRRLRLEDLDRELLITAALIGGWIDPVPPLTVRARAADEAYATLELSLVDSPMVMELVVDRASGEPQRLSRRSESGTNAWNFEGWQARAGALVPTRIRHVAADGGIENWIEFTEVAAMSFDDGRFGRPASEPDDVVFHDDAPALVETRRARTGHVLVRPLIEDREVGWFVFDTGAGGLVLDSEIADALALERFGQVVAVGVAARTTATFRQGTSFRLGGLELVDPIYVDLSLRFLENSLGVRVAGIVGYEVLAHTVVTLAPERTAGEDPRLEIHAPGSLAALPWQPLVLDERLPCVMARFDDERTDGAHEGLFKLDTGASGTVTFHAPAVERLRLLAGREVVRSRAAGIGGHGSVWRGPLDWFELATARFEGLVVEFATDDVGSFADVYTLGNIGQSLLAQFDLVFDYPGERIALLPAGSDVLESEAE